MTAWADERPQPGHSELVRLGVPSEESVFCSRYWGLRISTISEARHSERSLQSEESLLPFRESISLSPSATL